MLLTEDYVDKIKPYLNDLIGNHKTQSERKTELTMAINFISSKDSDETRTMHTKVIQKAMRQMKLLKNV